jgi:hypothetical protein
MSNQGELFGLLLQKRHPFRLRVNDIIRVEERLGLIIRVTECSAVVLVNRRPRQFKTRFDKEVRLQPAPKVFRISPNAGSEIVNRKTRRKRKSPNGKEVI